MSGEVWRAGTWSCPHPGCVKVGQVRAGHEAETDLAAHLRIVHGESPDEAGVR